jgi:hypothetical protein
MNLLDEHVPEDQRRLLRSWRVPVRQIGYDVGRKGIKDPEILSFLLGFRRPTFFTLDFDFYERKFCHRRYCLVCMEVDQHEAAAFVRRFLRHPEFDTVAKRMGKVIRLSSVQLVTWVRHLEQEVAFDWADE